MSFCSCTNLNWKKLYLKKKNFHFTLCSEICIVSYIRFVLWKVRPVAVGINGFDIFPLIGSERTIWTASHQEVLSYSIRNMVAQWMNGHCSSAERTGSRCKWLSQRAFLIRTIGHRRPRDRFLNFPVPSSKHSRCFMGPIDVREPGLASPGTGWERLQPSHTLFSWLSLLPLPLVLWCPLLPALLPGKLA